MLNCFFFSSRRRHTRCGRDWSSDVCSSDLAVLGGPERGRPGRAGGAVRPDAEPGDERAADLRVLAAPRVGGAGRADQDRQDGAGPRAPQEGDLLARPVARPASRPGAAGDHQPVIAPLVLALGLALQGSLADRVASAPDGEVRFSYATRPGVCGNGRNVISFECEDGRCGRHHMSFGSYDDDDAGCPCEAGPARVALHKRGGQVTRLRTYVGGAWRLAA